MILVGVENGISFWVSQAVRATSILMIEDGI